MKYLNINLTKYVEDLYKENDKPEKLQNYKTPLFLTVLSTCPTSASHFPPSFSPTYYTIQSHSINASSWKLISFWCLYVFEHTVLSNKLSLFSD